MASLLLILAHLKAHWRAYVLGFVFFVGMVCGGCVCNRWHSWFGEGPVGGMGWLEDPEQHGGFTRGQLLRTLSKPLFADVSRELADTPDKDALLYQHVQKVTGGHLPAHDQDGSGCCIGEGFSAAVEYLQCVQIALGKQPHEFKTISAAAVYALSRERGGLLGKGDGSFGSAAAAAVTKDGVLSCEDAKDDNTTGTEHAALAKKWGRTGLPRELKDKAKVRLVQTASLVDSAEDIRIAVSNGYPVAICSNVGFEPFRRNAEGMVRARGTWPHCMCVIAYRADKKWFCVLQSWGKTSPPGPKSLDQPDNSFWVVWDDMHRIAKQGESYALSSFAGFPRQEIDFWVARPLEVERWFASRRPLHSPFALAP